MEQLIRAQRAPGSSSMIIRLVPLDLTKSSSLSFTLKPGTHLSLFHCFAFFCIYIGLNFIDGLLKFVFFVWALFLKKKEEKIDFISMCKELRG